MSGARGPAASEIDPAHYQLERYAMGPKGGLPLRVYYAVKPWLPRRVQLTLRRRYARRQVRRDFPAWPIEPLLVDHFIAQMRARLRESRQDRIPIVNFWPGDRRFAAILTHDVEGPAGMENISRVLEVERRHGMVSSWNFVAEWYPIPDGMFERVRAAGGEIGLHGIKHDHRLFADRASFEANLPLIQRYLREWDAVGFRSPATHRNAEWMHNLPCLYDSSFPDTDPFEPQPGGCCSIHPFLLGDVVELPVTLVQDHTLWEILQQDSIELWTDKSDWIVRHHGLINVIVHPDYVGRPDRLELYDEFLGYLRRQLDAHAGWHALPREVAAWWKERAAVSLETREGVPRIVSKCSEGPSPSVAWVRATGDSIAIDIDGRPPYDERPA